MRIAFIVGQFPMLSETFILNQITGVIEQGHEVDIYTEYWGDCSCVHPDVHKFQLLERTYLLPSIPNNLFWRLSKGIALFLTHFHQSPRLLLSTLNLRKHGLLSGGLWLLYSAIPLMNKPTYDIVHCQFATQGYRGMFFKALLRPQPKLIITFRGHDISCYVQKQGKHVYDDLFQAGDFFLVNCEFFRQRVIHLGADPARTQVHFSGLDCKKFPFQSRQAEPTIQITTIGRLVEKKGIEYAIRAVAQKIQQYPNLKYQIIGDGPLKEHLQCLIHDLGAEESIALLGWKNEQEIIEILNQSHLFIAPSVTAADGNQDAPINVLKEAMAMGLPVISTHHGGIPELVQDGVSGFLVPERDVDALASKLEQLIQNPQWWEEMGKAGRAYVEEHFDLEQLNQRLLQLYEQLVNDSSIQERPLVESAIRSTPP
ncbi:MAG: glycosyltransferase [Cyanobacteria bacterium]|jgi:colanic acid/amylovoran biosynthesis glycosyltransferase|nr:glycosyltransferase [Cyanobacteria bacterium GSL.Bin1]